MLSGSGTRENNIVYGDCGRRLMEMYGNFIWLGSQKLAMKSFCTYNLTDWDGKREKMFKKFLNK